MSAHPFYLGLHRTPGYLFLLVDDFGNAVAINGQTISMLQQAMAETVACL